jgi:2-keto-3-deoxy-L-rhamnonate aldolase RhmA
VTQPARRGDRAAHLLRAVRGAAAGICGGGACLPLAGRFATSPDRIGPAKVRIGLILWVESARSPRGAGGHRTRPCPYPGRRKGRRDRCDCGGGGKTLHRCGTTLVAVGGAVGLSRAAAQALRARF